MRSGGPAVFLCLILVTGFGLRVWGSRFGLPTYTRYHPDEHALVERAAQIVWTGDWNLHRFNYPPAYAYLQTIGYAIYARCAVVKGMWRSVPAFVVPSYYQVGRLLTALFGTLTVLVVYLAARQLKGRRAGLLAATLLAANYLHAIHSHYATFDVMVGFWAALTFLFSVRLADSQQTRWYVLAGLCAGLAGATKYNGAIAVVLPIMAHIFHSSRGRYGWLNTNLVLAGGGFLLGFFGGNPFALGNMQDFLTGLATVLDHYGTQHPGFEGRGNWRWYPGVFFTSADSLWVVIGTLGLASALLEEWKRGLLLVCFPIIYYVAVSWFIVRFERNMVPLLPFLAIAGGWFLEVGASRLALHIRRVDVSSSLLAVLGAALVVCVPLTASIAFDVSLSQTDHREIAGEWVENNVEKGSKIAIEHYSIPFDYDQYEVEDVIRASDHDLDWYHQEGFDVLIVSDGVWEVLRREPEVYADKLEALAQIVDHSVLLAEFVPEPQGIVVAGYPTVKVYHFAPVRVYRLRS